MRSTFLNLSGRPVLFRPIAKVIGAVAAICAVLIQSQLILAATFDSISSNPWQGGTTWSPAGPPTSGNSVQISGDTVTVNDLRSFGAGGLDTSIMVGTSPTFSMTGTGELTHVSGSTLIKEAAIDARITGTGKFINQGTFEIRNNRLLMYSSNPTLENFGLFLLSQNGSQLTIGNSGAEAPQFNNMPGGTVRVALPLTTDVARIVSNGPTLTGGNYANLGGNAIDFDQGALVFGPANAGSLTDASFANLFGNISADGGTTPNNPLAELRLAGSWDSVTLTGLTDLSRVRLAGGTGADSFFARPGGTIINVTTPGGITMGNILSGGTPTLEVATGRTMTNAAGSLIIKGSGVDGRIIGNGTFDNQGTFEIRNNRLLLYTGNPIISNSGLFLLSENGSQITMGNSGAEAPQFNNLPGGTVRVALPSATHIARIVSNGPTLTGGNYANLGGNAIDFDQGVLVFGPANAGTLTDASFASIFGNISADGGTTPNNPLAELRLAGSWDSVTLTGATDLSRVRLSGGTGADSFFARSTGTTINVTAPGGITMGNILTGGTPTLEVATGRTMTNLAGSLIVKGSGVDGRIIGNGTFINQGTFEVKNNRLLLYTGSPKFENSGLFLLSENGSILTLGNSGAEAPQFKNFADGVVRADLPTGANTATIQRGGNTTATFDNVGAVEVLRGTLNILSNVNILPQVISGGTTLDGGTWSILADGVGNNSALNLAAGGTSAGSIVTINSNASVLLSAKNGATATFSQLGAISTMSGSLMVHGDVNHAVAAAMNVTGTLGGDGIITSPGTITLNGGELDPSSLSGGAGTLTLNGNLTLGNTTQLSFSLDNSGIIGGGINDLVVVNGNLTLDGILDITELPNFGTGTYRLFNYSGTLFDNGLTLNNPYYLLDTGTFGQVNLTILPVPEPSTACLLLAGLVALRRRKRS